MNNNFIKMEFLGTSSNFNGPKHYCKKWLISWTCAKKQKQKEEKRKAPMQRTLDYKIYFLAYSTQKELEKSIQKGKVKINSKNLKKKKKKRGLNMNKQTSVMFLTCACRHIITKWNKAIWTKWIREIQNKIHFTIG